MKKMKFLTTMLVVSTFTVSSLTFIGCDKNKKSSNNQNTFEEVIEADSEWFDVETNQVELPSEASNSFPMLTSETVAGNQLVSTLGTDSGNYLLFNSLDGKLNNSIKLSDNSKGAAMSSYTLHHHGDVLLLSKTDFKKDGTNTTTSQKIDLDNNTIIDETINIEDAYLYGSAIGKENESMGFIATKDLYVGDKLISILVNPAKNEQRLAITDKSNNIQNVDAKGTFKEGFQISNMLPISSNEVLIVTTNYENGSCLYYTFNLQDNTASEFNANENFASIIDKTSTFISDSNDNLIVNSNGELSTLNFKEQKADKLFNYSNSFVNPASMRNASILSVDKDKYVFLAQTLVNDEQTKQLSRTNDILLFTKSDKNPNKGKDVITLASINPTGLSRHLGNIICSYNKNSDDFFVKYAPEYEIKNPSMTYETKNNEQEIQAQKVELIDKLSNDILNNNAPDIILDAFDNDSLNNDRYFEDLSSHKFDEDTYFTNIIDATKTNDKLYQIPLSFCLDTISTLSDNVPSNTIGFDYDSYETFVKQKCNGMDPIVCSAANYSTNGLNNLQFKLLKTMLNAMGEPIINNGKINIDNDEFKSIVNYVKNSKQNVTSITPPGEDSPERTLKTTLSPAGLTFYGTNKSIKFLGLPSTTPHAPSAIIENSAAITVTSKHKDAAWEFIESILNPKDDSSKNDFFANATSFNINKNENNNAIKIATNRINYSDEDCKAINDMIEEVTMVEGIDASLFNIISEELEPYFSGDKSYDNVLKLITDRCNKFLDENK